MKVLNTQVSNPKLTNLVVSLPTVKGTSTQLSRASIYSQGKKLSFSFFGLFPAAMDYEIMKRVKFYQNFLGFEWKKTE